MAGIQQRRFAGSCLCTFLVLALLPACGNSDDSSEEGTGGSGSGGASNEAGGTGGDDHEHGDGDGDHHHEVTAGAPGSGGSEMDDAHVECGDAGSCGLVECEVEEASGIHVAFCDPLTPHSNPPTSGPHYPNWAQFGIYDEPIHPGLLLHTLEHSAVALLYNCELVEDSGASCDELISELTHFYDDWEEDPLCTAVPHRLVIAPDPELDVPFAAAAWKYHLKGDCFDEETVTEFIHSHYGMNYEDICGSGIDPSTLDCE